VHQGERCPISGAAHVDSGFVTLLAQAGVSGLQARSATGDWIDVPPREGTLTVNFGKLMQRWTDGRIKATEHRVLGSAEERFSIPFFYEPRVDAEIAPLPGVRILHPSCLAIICGKRQRSSSNFRVLNCCGRCAGPQSKAEPDHGNLPAVRFGRRRDRRDCSSDDVARLSTPQSLFSA
jgi:hypothetical protein